MVILFPSTVSFVLNPLQLVFPLTSVKGALKFKLGLASGYKPLKAILTPVM
ncbi:hypothetical protein D3C86_2128380 [compost metagenome]